MAIVGPNEAGKSSTLDALEQLNNNHAIPTADLANPGTVEQSDVIFEAGFTLDEQDKALLPESTQCSQLLVRKRVNGQRTFRLTPDPAEDLRTREACLRSLQEQQHIKPIRDTLDKHADALTALASEESKLDDVAIKALRALHEDLTAEKLVPPGIALAIAWQAAYETNREVGAELRRRIPKFRKFTDQDRALTSKYHVPSSFDDNDKQKPLPSALQNLCAASGLDLLQVHLANKGNNVPHRDQLLDRASDVLTQLLQQSWTQGQPRVKLSMEQSLHLVILVIGEGGTYVSLDGRSDGLRRFLALLCFLRGSRNAEPGSIILLDEAESQLHYDAQAELIQVFSLQSLTPKIIYTTHSMGCLPNDLGGGVRFIRTDGDTSDFANNLWAQSATSSHEERRAIGFEPLLYSMGATRLAFVPMRAAVIVEGVSDMILLPSMLQESAGTDALSFQVVGGLSQLSNAELCLIGQQGRGVVCVVDSDGGGEDLRKALQKAKVPEQKVLKLPVPDGRTIATLEDFVDKCVYLDAVNALVSTFQAPLGAIKEDEVADERRAKSVDEWCAAQGGTKVDKKQVAAHILARVQQNDGQRIVSTEGRPLLRDLVHEIETKLQQARED